MIYVNNLTYPPQRRITSLNLPWTGKLWRLPVYELPRGTKSTVWYRQNAFSLRASGTVELSETRLSLLG